MKSLISEITRDDLFCLSARDPVSQCCATQEATVRRRVWLYPRVSAQLVISALAATITEHQSSVRLAITVQRARPQNSSVLLEHSLVSARTCIHY